MNIEGRQEVNLDTSYMYIPSYLALRDFDGKCFISTVFNIIFIIPYLQRLKPVAVQPKLILPHLPLVSIYLVECTVKQLKTRPGTTIRNV